MAPKCNLLQHGRSRNVNFFTIGVFISWCVDICKSLLIPLPKETLDVLRHRRLGMSNFEAWDWIIRLEHILFGPLRVCVRCDINRLFEFLSGNALNESGLPGPSLANNEDNVHTLNVVQSFFTLRNTFAQKIHIEGSGNRSDLDKARRFCLIVLLLIRVKVEANVIFTLITTTVVRRSGVAITGTMLLRGPRPSNNMPLVTRRVRIAFGFNRFHSHLR